MPRYRPKDHQIVRCVTLLVAMAHAKRGIQLRPFYRKRGWNMRTAYRDVELLRDEAKIPVEQPEHGWYRVPAAWLPPSTLNVTRDEASALAVMISLVPSLRESTLGRAIQELRAKLGPASAQTQLELEPVAIRSRVLPAIDYAPHRATIDAVSRAIEQRHLVRVVYRDARGEKSERIIEPGIVHYEPTSEALYLIAWCRLRAAVRTFAVHRVEAAEVMEEKFVARAEIEAEMANALRVWTRPHTQHVKMRFTAAVAAEVRERRWHASQRVAESGEDGTVVVELEIAAPEELERTLLGYAADVEVLEPESLARRLCELHMAAAAAQAGSTRFPALHARRTRGSEEELPTRVTG
jgi:predicted DNA-binding transcriptional regulator YafY